MFTQYLFKLVELSCLLLKMKLLFSDHIVAQQANRYIVAFHITISYDMQQPRYNGRAVGLRAACMVSLPWRTTVRADQSTAALDSSVWNTLNGHVSRWRWARLMFDVHGHWQYAAETGTIYNDVFTGSTRRRHGLTWAGAWWPGLVSRYTDSFSQL